MSIFDLIIPWKENLINAQNQIKEQKKTTQTSLSSFLSKNKGGKFNYYNNTTTLDAAHKSDHANGSLHANDKTKN